MTAEDIIPTWARETAKELSFVGQPVSRILGRLCRPCNGRLSTEFENEIAPILKPFIRGLPYPMTIAQQRLVSRWCVKTALVAVVADLRKEAEEYPPGLQDFCRLLLLDLLDHGQFPEGTSIRIFLVDDSWPREAPFDIPAPLASYAFSRIMTCGFFGFEVAFCGPRHSPDELKATKSEERLLRLWPVQGDMVGFFIGRLSLPEFELLRTAWHHNRQRGGYAQVDFANSTMELRRMHGLEPNPPA